MTIGQLPDNVLLEIFRFYRVAVLRFRDYTWNWYTLAHVCSRWRQVILASPHLLDPRLICTARTPVMEMLDVYPTFPIIIDCQHLVSSISHTFMGWGNIIAALRCRDQACWISLSGLTGPLLGFFVTMMKDPFPALTFLELRSNDGIDGLAPVLPEAFLGQFAPRLQYLILQGISFPTLPSLLFSADDLVSLHLADIPITGCIAPEVLTVSLSALPRLRWLIIMFTSPTPLTNRTAQQPPPITRAVLPSLTFLSFRGASEYIEDLVARIRAPRLNHINTQFFEQALFDTPELFRFISRSRKLRSLNRATVSFYHSLAKIVFGSSEGTLRPRHVSLGISCGGSNRQISSVAQICSQYMPLLSNVKWLNIKGGECLQPGWQDETNSAQWLELLHPFTAVERLHISERLGPLIVRAFQGLTGERATVLPLLHSLFLQGLLPSASVREVIDPFITARHLSGCPIAVRWG